MVTSTIDQTAEVVNVETSAGVFQKRNAGDWVLYWGKDDISSFTFDQNNTIWIGSNGSFPRSLTHLDMYTGSYTDYVLDHVVDITTIEIDKNEVLWVGSPTYRFKEGKWLFFGIYNWTPQISPDNSNWVLSLNPLPACPARYAQDIWMRFCPPFMDNTVLAYPYLIDNMGNIWLSTRKDYYNQGVWKLGSAGWELVKELASDKDFPYFMAQGPTGDLWFVSSRLSLSQKEIGRIKHFDGKNWLLDIENPADLMGMSMGGSKRVDKNNIPWILGRDNTDEYILRLNNNQWEKMVSGSELGHIWGGNLQMFSFGFSPSGNLCLGTSLGFMCRTK